MLIKLVSEPQYRITERPGFERVIFTESSDDFLVWPQAVKFAAKRDAVLQSLREAAAFRIETGLKDDDADLYQATRTAAAYFKDKDGKLYVAFDDIPNPQKNIILARVQEGYDANRKGREFVLSKKDKHIAQLLKRAEKSGRVVEVVESPLELATKASEGSSEFGSNNIVQALFGDMAEPYAAMHHKSGHCKGFVYVLTQERLDKQVDTQSALVRPVGLGLDLLGDRAYDTGDDSRFNRFDYGGCARGVRGAKEFKPVRELAPST